MGEHMGECMGTHMCVCILMPASGFVSVYMPACSLERCIKCHRIRLSSSAPPTTTQCRTAHGRACIVLCKRCALELGCSLCAAAATAWRCRYLPNLYECCFHREPSTLNPQRQALGTEPQPGFDPGCDAQREDEVASESGLGLIR
jgi:hypothetical protein